MYVYNIIYYIGTPPAADHNPIADIIYSIIILCAAEYACTTIKKYFRR